MTDMFSADMEGDYWLVNFPDGTYSKLYATRQTAAKHALNWQASNRNVQYRFDLPEIVKLKIRKDKPVKVPKTLLHVQALNRLGLRMNCTKRIYYKPKVISQFESKEYYNSVRFALGVVTDRQLLRIQTVAVQLKGQMNFARDFDFRKFGDEQNEIRRELSKDKSLIYSREGVHFFDSEYSVIRAKMLGLAVHWSANLHEDGKNEDA